jgi:glycerophosphoryl diester phosphodiesterase
MGKTIYMKTNLISLLFSSGILVCATTAIAQAKKTGITMPTKGICAHRGGMDTHPENTFPAFEEAIYLGAQMIEFDIQLTRDSVAVIMHDDTVDRTTNGTGKVSDLTLLEIRKLDAGVKKGAEFTGTRVPTFEEVLSIMPRNVWLNCHLKGGAAVGAAATALVVKAGRLHQSVIACGEEAAAAARRTDPSVIICNAENRYRRDTKTYVEATIKSKDAFIQLLPTPSGEDRLSLIKRLKAESVKINYYYASSPIEASNLFDAGIDFILVNDVAKFLPETEKRGIKPVRPLF